LADEFLAEDPPSPVSACEMASVSTTVAPSLSNSSAAALLPLPMPPVSPTTSFFAGGGFNLSLGTT
jgi:hypothetical protein